MSYIIHHKNLLPSASQAYFEEQVRRKLLTIEKILSTNPKKQPLVHVFISHPVSNLDLNEISVSTRLKAKTFFVTEKGTRVTTLINHLLDKLKRQILRHMSIVRKERSFKRKNRRVQNIIELQGQSDKSFSKKDKRKSDEIAMATIPSQRAHATQKVKAFELLKSQPPRSSGEAVNEVMLQAYAEFEGRAVDLTKFTAWVYRKADAILDKIYDMKPGGNTVPIEQRAPAEIKSKEQDFTGDTDGDLALKHLLLNRPELQSPLRLSKLVKYILENYCSELAQDVFVLYHMDELTEKEISKIANLSQEAYVKMSASSHYQDDYPSPNRKQSFMQHLTIELRQPGNDGYSGADLFENAMIDQNLVFYADSLTDIGFEPLTGITDGVTRAIEICSKHGLPVKNHFKTVYISDANTHTIRKAWRLSKLAYALVVINGSYKNPMVSQLQLELLRKYLGL